MFGKYEVRNKLLIKKDMLEINISRIAENVSSIIESMETIGCPRK